MLVDSIRYASLSIMLNSSCKSNRGPVSMEPLQSTDHVISIAMNYTRIDFKSIFQLFADASVSVSSIKSIEKGEIKKY